MVVHEQLSLHIGVPSLPSDTRPYRVARLAEDAEAMQNLNLLGGSSGLTLVNDSEWWPKQPGIKQDGLWYDSSTDAGRRLHQAVMANVTEDIQCRLSGSDLQELAQRLTRLRRFVNAAQTFATGGGNDVPVYIAWKAAEAALPQYARIENVSFSVDTPPQGTPAIQYVTLKVEREPAWYGIRPGENPLIWHRLAAGLTPGDDFDATDLVPGNSANYPFTADLYNGECFGDTGVDTDTREKTRWGWSLDIPGEQIPGDAPARVFMKLRPPAANSDYSNWIVARDTKRLTEELYSGTDTVKRFLTVNCCDKAAGSPSMSHGALKFNTASGTYVNNIGVDSWGISGTEPRYSAHMFRGRHMVFVRGFQDAGLKGDVDLLLRIGVATRSIAELEATAEWDDTNVTTKTYPALTYMGEIEIPEGTTGDHDVAYGSGPDLDATLQLYLASTIDGSNGCTAYYGVDIVFVPIDEYIIEVHNAGYLDNTGYLDGGHRRDQAYHNIGFSITSPPDTPVAEMRGRIPQLDPGVDNTLRILTFTDTNQARLNYTALATAAVAVIPGFYGMMEISLP